MEGFEGLGAPSRSFELDQAAALRPALVIRENVDSDDFSGLAHMVFEVFPGSIPVKIRQKYAAIPHSGLVIHNITLVKHARADHFALRKLLGVTALPKQGIST